MLPDAKGYASMLRFITGDTDALRQHLREEVLATTQEDFRAFARIMDYVKEQGVIKVLGSPDILDESSRGKDLPKLQPLKVL